MEPLQEAMFKIGKQQSGPHPYRDTALLAVFLADLVHISNSFYPFTSLEGL